MNYKIAMTPIIISTLVLASSACQPPNPPPVGSFDCTGGQLDLSGKICVKLFPESVTYNPRDKKITVGSDFVVVGGGVTGSGSPGQYLTGSYPDPSLDSWVIGTKDHIDIDHSNVTGYAIGLKIKDVSKNDLKAHMSIIQQTSSPATNSPTVSVSNSLSGLAMVGGGFRVNYSGNGNMGTATYPNHESKWTAESKDHILPNSSTITAYAILIDKNIGGGSIETQLFKSNGVYSGQPEDSVDVFGGYALSTCGAEVDWSGVGNLLRKIEPRISGASGGCTAASKDNQEYSPATIYAYAIGIKMI